MATSWTEYNPTSDVNWADNNPTSNAEYFQLEPPLGFGQTPFGDEGEDGIVIHLRGFGDPKTEWTDV